VLSQKITLITKPVLILPLLLLCGCVTVDQHKFVFGPAQPGETSVSLKKLVPQKGASKKTRVNLSQVDNDKNPEEMSKQELVEHVKNLTGDGASKKMATEDKKSLKKPSSLSFPVKNNTGKTLWVTCFAYLQRYSYCSWRWEKSPVCKLEPGKTCMMQIDSVYSKEVEKSVFGYLGVFKTFAEAEQSTYQLLDDAQKLDLDLIYKIGDNTVTLEVEKYGAEGQNFDYHLTGKQIEQLGYQPELDFFVENKTGKTVLVTCFVYEQPIDTTDSPVWKYVKTAVQKIEHGELALIDAASSRDLYASQYMRGTLGIFDEDEEDEAEAATFQLLPEKKKIMLDRLIGLRGKKIVLSVEKYGSEGDFIDYVIKTRPRRTPGTSVGS
jgi:hypothetical protein